MLALLKKFYGLRYPKWAENIRLETRDRVLHLTYLWIHATQGYAAMVMAAFASLFMMAGLYFVVRFGLLGNAPHLLRFFAGIFALILMSSVPLFYNCLGMLMNRTTVRLGKDEIRVSRGPLPWTGGFTRSTGDIRAIEVREMGIFYDLMMVTKNGKEKRLVRAIADHKNALKDFKNRAGRFLSA